MVRSTCAGWPGRTPQAGCGPGATDMSDRLSATDRSYRQESADGSYFAPLAQTRYLLLTTFRQKGAPVCVRVQGIIDGDRAYFRTRSRSGTVKRLRHANRVQVTPCDVLGLCSYGPP